MEARLRGHLNRLQTGLASTTERPTSIRKSRPRTAPFRRIVIATSIAAAAFLMMVFTFGPVDALAQIAQSVAAKKWLHATGVGPHGQPVEFWYSPVHGILASSQGGTALFVDLVNRQMDVFGKPFSTDSIQRTKVDRSNDGGIVASQQTLLALLSGDLVTAMKSGNLRALEHHVRSIEVAGQERSEHRFVIQSNENKQFRSETLLQVDPKSGLPVQWQIRSDGQLIGDFTLSYPELGPTTIFGLGVAAQTPISDMTPRGTFLELMTSNDAARNRFDDYHAVLIESKSSDRGAHGAYYRIWKKGHRWRIDRGQRLLYKHEQPTADADPEQWWLQKTKSLRSLPLEIWDGKRFWNFVPQYVEPKTEDPTEPGVLLIQSLKTMNGIPLDPDNPRMHFGGLVTLPEQFAYESLHQATSLGYYT